jgi:hypothetical protein
MMAKWTQHNPQSNIIKGKYTKTKKPKRQKGEMRRQPFCFEPTLGKGKRRSAGLWLMISRLAAAAGGIGPKCVERNWNGGKMVSQKGPHQNSCSPLAQR